ncbi:hypothetical protein MDAP_000341 [Mitosporidium daphniae]
MIQQYFSAIPLIENMTPAILASFLSFLVSFLNIKLLLYQMNADKKSISFPYSLLQCSILYLISEQDVNLSFLNMIIISIVLFPIFYFDVLLVSIPFLFFERNDLHSYQSFRLQNPSFLKFRLCLLGGVSALVLVPAFDKYIILFTILALIYLLAFGILIPSITNSFSSELIHTVKLMAIPFFVQYDFSLLLESGELLRYAPNIVRISANDHLIYDSADWKRILNAIPAYISVYIKSDDFNVNEYPFASPSSSSPTHPLYRYKSTKRPPKKDMLSNFVLHSLNSQVSIKEALHKEANISLSQMKSFWISNVLILKVVPFSDNLMNVLAKYRSNATWVMYEVFLKSKKKSYDDARTEHKHFYYKFHIHMYSNGASKKKKVDIVSLDKKDRLMNVEPNKGPCTFNKNNGFNDLTSYFDESIEKAWSTTKGEGSIVGFMNFCPFSTKELLAYKPPQPNAKISDMQRIHDSGLLEATSTFGINGRAIAPNAHVIGAAGYTPAQPGGFSISGLCDLLDDAQFLIAPNGDQSIGADVVVLSSYVLLLDPDASFRDSLLELEIWKRIVKVWDILGIIPVMAAGSVSKDNDFVDILRSLSRVIIVGSVSGATGNPSLFSARGMSSYNWNGRMLPDFMAPGEPIDLTTAVGKYIEPDETATFEQVIGEGTSFSASSVAFTIALMRSISPGIYLEDAIAILNETSIRPSCWDQIESYNSMESHYLLDVISFRDPNGTLSYPNVLYGSGIIDPFKAVKASRNHESYKSMPRQFIVKATTLIEDIEDFIFGSSATPIFKPHVLLTIILPFFILV